MNMLIESLKLNYFLFLSLLVYESFKMKNNINHTISLTQVSFQAYCEVAKVPGYIPKK